ncbi:hypothetical protein phi16_gp017 [Corynebacterium phage phi16]|uniref:hypothetical protein n=1 Tax=Corynebacterium glutamicum TaxID=1718 RepID=UPI0009455EE9|nr:hypothetical protein [Corynebacterium glutamicum]APQ42522.1 hypothetical protein phi16_gp017 [Corynebacterium phage phi16]OKX80483.1 hypothetical protein AUO95_10025 [Corynebacterium glutamicum]
MEVKVVSWDGTTFDLTTNNLPRVQLDAGGINSLKGALTISADSRLGRAGQTRRRVKIPSFSGSLSGRIVAESEEERIRLVSAWRRAFHWNKPSTIWLTPTAGKDVFCHAVYSSPLDIPAQDLRDLEEVPFSWALDVDDGVWWDSPQTGTGNVTVTNWGDDYICPSVVWKGSSQKVTLPSGAVISLPNVSLQQPRRLLLDDEESLMVFDLDGNEDRSLWPIDTAFAEGVPPLESREYVTTANATLEWAVPVLDPWR